MLRLCRRGLNHVWPKLYKPYQGYPVKSSLSIVTVVCMQSCVCVCVCVFNIAYKNALAQVYYFTKSYLQ